MIRALLLLALIALAPARAAAPDPRAGYPLGLVITLHVRPADRPAFHDALAGEARARLDALRRDRRIETYQILWSRYADGPGWDALLLIRFPDAAAAAGWRSVESETPAGLPANALRFVSAIETTPVDLMREQAPAGSEPAPVYLVLPYSILVPPPDYLRYFDGYVQPQVAGWAGEGVLEGFFLYLPRAPAGRPWQALLVLAYRGDAGLGGREAAVARVRQRLASDPAWQAFAGDKRAYREERLGVVADPLVP